MRGRDDKSHSEKATQTFLQQEIMRRRGEIMAEVLHEADNDFRAVMGRLQIAQAVKDAVFKEEEAEEEAAPRAKAARATKAKRQPLLKKLRLRHQRWVRGAELSEGRGGGDAACGLAEAAAG